MDRNFKNFSLFEEKAMQKNADGTVPVGVEVAMNVLPLLFSQEVKATLENLFVTSGFGPECHKNVTIQGVQVDCCEGGSFNLAYFPFGGKRYYLYHH